MICIGFLKIYKIPVSSDIFLIGISIELLFRSAKIFEQRGPPMPIPRHESHIYSALPCCSSAVSYASGSPFFWRYVHSNRTPSVIPGAAHYFRTSVRVSYILGKSEKSQHPSRRCYNIYAYVVVLADTKLMIDNRSYII